MKQRIFVAITLPAALKQRIARWQQTNRDLPVRYIAPENLHLTVVPPWYGHAKTEVKLLKKHVPAVKAFRVNFWRIIAGPTTIAPRLIWLEGKASKPAGVLKKELEKLLGVKSEKRTFVPHVTLARIKAHEELPVEQNNTSQCVGWSLRVTSYALFASHPSPAGARYEILAEFPLIGIKA